MHNRVPPPFAVAGFNLER